MAILTSAEYTITFDGLGEYRLTLVGGDFNDISHLIGKHVEITERPDVNHDTSPRNLNHASTPWLIVPTDELMRNIVAPPPIKIEPVIKRAVQNSIGELELENITPNKSEVS